MQPLLWFALATGLGLDVAPETHWWTSFLFPQSNRTTEFAVL
jgi:hypothetical protein